MPARRLLVRNPVQTGGVVTTLSVSAAIKRAPEPTRRRQMNAMPVDSEAASIFDDPCLWNVTLLSCRASTTVAVSGRCAARV